MKRFLGGTLFVLLGTGVLGSTASASSVLELFDNNNGSYVTITDTGTGTRNVAGGTIGTGNVDCVGADCAGATINVITALGSITIGAGSTFDSFTITESAGGSNSPSCSGAPNGPGCINTDNINSVSSAAASLSAYYADTGFMPGGATGLTVGFSTPGETGTTATQTAYATAGAHNPLNPVTGTPATPVLGLTPCGANPLTINGPTANTSLSTGCASPGQPFSLELATTMTATGAGQAFNLNGTISAVPEPAAVALFGTALALCASRLRRKRHAG